MSKHLFVWFLFFEYNWILFGIFRKLVILYIQKRSSSFLSFFLMNFTSFNHASPANSYSSLARIPQIRFLSFPYFASICPTRSSPRSFGSSESRSPRQKIFRDRAPENLHLTQNRGFSLQGSSRILSPPPHHPPRVFVSVVVDRDVEGSVGARRAANRPIRSATSTVATFRLPVPASPIRYRSRIILSSRTIAGIPARLSRHSGSPSQGRVQVAWANWTSA